MSQQINRSVKKFSEIEQSKLKDIVNYLLIHEDVDYEGFLELINFNDNKSKLNISCSNDDENLYKIALSWVFGESYFNNSLSEKKFLETLDNWIAISKDYKENILLGASGSGKTSLFKYLIGAENSDYPATSDGNTTVGKNRMVIDLLANKLSAAMWFKNKVAIRERLNVYMQDGVDLCLKSECNDKLYNELYDALILSKDSKWRLEYIINSNNLTNLNIDGTSFLDAIYLESKKLWDKFKKSDYFYSYNLKYDVSYKDALVADTNIKQEVKNFISGEIDNEESYINKILNAIYNMVVENEYIVMNRIYKELFKRKNYLKFKFEAIFNNMKFKANNEESERDCFIARDKFETVEALFIEIGYINDNNPDEALRTDFFRILENISSSNKENYNLFALLNEMRVYGNFRPTGFTEDSDNGYKEIFVISDYEGLLHDISANQVLSTKTQNSIANANKIFLTYNVGTAEAKGGIIPILEYLIISGGMYKTKICFTKLDLLSDNDKNTRIKGYIKNVLEAIDKNGKIEGLDTEMYVREIMHKAYYFSNMNKSNDSKILKFREKYERLKGIDEDLAKELKETIEMIETEKATTEDIIPLYKQFMNNINIQDISEYLSDAKGIFNIVVSKIVRDAIKAQESFIKEFLNALDQSEWQTEKAFNLRIAKNYDGREWRHLMPEAMLITKLNLIIRNCINNDIISKLDGNAKRCVNIYCDVMIEESGKKLKEAIKKVIYENMLDNYWMPAASKRDSGSTYERHTIIKKGIIEEFDINKDICEEYPSLYSIIIETLNKNEKFKKLNVQLDSSK